VKLLKNKLLSPCIPYPCAASRYKMGTLSGGSAASLALFDGQPQHWQTFKAKVCRLCDEKYWGWLIEGANVLSDHLQVIVAAMTATSKRSAGGISTDFSKFSKQAIDEVAKKLRDSQAQFQLKYACIKNKKDPFGAHFINPEKMGYSMDDLAILPRPTRIVINNTQLR
jgi:hypothetical protein